MNPLVGRRALLSAATGFLAGTLAARIDAATSSSAAIGERTAPLPPPTLSLPSRNEGAAGATTLVDALTGKPLAEAQERLADEIVAGNVPSFLRTLHPIAVGDATLWTLSDYLAVGSDDDHLWVPLAAPVAQRIANALGALLPTPQIVDAIHQSAEARLPAVGLEGPVGLGCLRQTRHHGRILTSLMKARKIEPGVLLSGHKKDVVVSPALNWARGRVAIYGFFREGRPVQPLSTVHVVTYVDYSHGIRLLADAIDRDGVRARLSEVLGDPERATIVSTPGAVVLPAYPATWEEAVEAQRQAWRESG